MGKISDTVQNVVSEIRSSKKARGSALRTPLGKSNRFMKDIHRTNAELAKVTSKMLEGFHMEHGDMARAQRENLSSQDEARVGATREFMEQVGVKVSEIRSGTQNLLERFDLEHGDMARILREKLSSEHRALVSVTQGFMGQVHKVNSDCREAVRKMLDEISSDLQQAHDIWGRPVKKKTVLKAAPKPAFEEIEKKPGLEVQKKKVLEVVAGHAEGIRLIDIGNERGVDWRTLIGPIKSLVDQGKIEKIDNMYYPKE